MTAGRQDKNMIKKIDLKTEAYLNTLKERGKMRCDFPSPEHELAWKIAEYFNEPYAFWVRKVRGTNLLLGQVERIFFGLMKRDFKKKQMVRMLMADLFPHAIPNSGIVQKKD